MINMEEKYINNNKEDHPVTLSGCILPSDISRHGKVLEVIIETEDFQQFIVTPNKKGKELFNLLYSNVSVNGLISGEDAYGKMIIIIKEYNIN